jgi:two-component system chemotaxis response regulator CheY
METFEALLVDSRYYQSASIDLVTLGWRHNQFMICGLFNFYGSVENEWQARLIGSHVFSGDRALDTIRSILAAIPSSVESVTSSSVLLVEDLDSPRFIISSYIEALGCGSVEAVSSGKEALEILAKTVEKFFCIIADVNMPEMTGIDLVRKIRANPKVEHLPVIMLTSYATVDNLISCVEAGATGFLVKPPQKRTLRQEIEKAQRIFVTKQSPRLCSPKDAHLLQEVLTDITLH